MRITASLLTFLFCLSNIYAAPTAAKTSSKTIDTTKIVSTPNSAPTDSGKISAEAQQTAKEIETISFSPKLKSLIDIANEKPKDSIYYTTYINEAKATPLDLKLNDAAKLYKKKDYDKALKIYNEIINGNANKATTFKAIQYKIQIYNVTNKKDSVKKTLTSLVSKKYSDTINIFALRHLINIAKSEKQYPEAIELSQKLLILDTAQSSNINSDIVDIYILSKQYSKAQEILNKLVASDTTSKQLAKAYYSLGMIALNTSKELGDGLMYINKSLQYDPGNKNTLTAKAKINFAVKDYEKALADLALVIDSSATSDLYYYAGVSCYMLGKDNEAIKYLNKVSGNELALYFKALSKRFLAKEGGVSKSLENSKNDLTKLMKKYNDPHVKYCYALLLVDEGNAQEAFKEIDQLIKDFPNFIKGYQARADFFIKNKKYKEAKKDLLFILSKKGQNDVFTLLKLAFIETESKKYKEAISILEAAKSISPKSATIYIQLSRNWFMLKNVAEAESNLKIAIGIDPYNETALIELAKIYVATNRGKDAIELCTNIIKSINKKNFFAFVYKGLGQVAQGDKKGGCESIKTAQDIAKANENKEFIAQVESLLVQNCGAAPTSGKADKKAAPEKKAAPAKAEKKKK